MLAAVAAWLGRLLARLAAMLPGPPTKDASAPDVDGRRPEAADRTAIEMETLRKDGHGGYR